MRRLTLSLSALVLLGASLGQAEDLKLKEEDLNQVLRDEPKKPLAKPATPAKKTPSAATATAAAPTVPAELSSQPAAGTAAFAPAPAGEPAATGTTEPSAPQPDASAPAKEDPALVLPKVEIRKRKLQKLDELLQQHGKEMEREAENTKSTDVDDALNDDKFTLSIFGGKSSQVRKKLAEERLYLMQFEKDLLEAIALTKDDEEKADLEKYLQDIKKMRRELEGVPPSER